jgi:fermentation-respiration switch protein FrsA (DUF1100 family)
MPLSILIITGACLGVLALIAGAFGWVAAYRLTQRRTPDMPDSPSNYGLPFEAVRFPTRDGLQLGGWHVTGSEPRPTVVLCPGHNGSMDADLKHASWLWQAGFDLLLFDWRAHGASEGQRVSMGVHERLDLLGALDFLRGRDGAKPPERSVRVTHIGLLGFSMGGAVALRVAAEDDTGLVKAVVSDGGFAHIESAIVGHLIEDRGLPSILGRALGRLALWMAGVRVGARLSEADPLPHMGGIAPTPILFIHGASDPYVPVPEQDALYEAAGEPKRLWRLEDAGHRDADDLHPQAYQERVVDFFREFLVG